MMEGRTKQTLDAPVPFYGRGININIIQDGFYLSKVVYNVYYMQTISQPQYM